MGDEETSRSKRKFQGFSDSVIAVIDNTEPSVLYFMFRLKYIADYNIKLLYKFSTVPTNIRLPFKTACETLLNSLFQDTDIPSYQMETILQYQLSFETSVRKLMEHDINYEILKPILSDVKTAQVGRWLYQYHVEKSFLKLKYSLFPDLSDDILKALRLSLKPLRKQYKLIFKSTTIRILKQNVVEFLKLIDEWRSTHTAEIDGFKEETPLEGTMLPLEIYTTMNMQIAEAQERVNAIILSLNMDLKSFDKSKHHLFTEQSYTWSDMNHLIDSINFKLSIYATS